MSRIVGGTTIKDTAHSCTCLSFVFKSSRKCATLFCSDSSQATHNGIYWAYSCTHSLAQRIRIAGWISTWWCHRTSRRVYCVHVVSKWMIIVWEYWTCNRKPPTDKRPSCIGMLCENASSLSHETRIRFAHCIGWQNRGKTNPIIRHSLASMRERLGPLRHRTKPHLWSSQIPDLWWVVVNFWWRHCGEGLQHETAWLLVQGIIEGGSFGSPSLWKWYSTTAPFFQKSRDFILHQKKSFSRGRFRLILEANSFLLQKRSWKKE